MADKSVETNVNGSTDAIGMWGPYWSDKDTAVIVFVDVEVDLSFARTTDGGINWTTTEVEVGQDVVLACWYDKETPGDTGTLVHMAWLDTTGGDFAEYRTVDVSDGSLGTLRTVDSGVTVDNTPANNKIAITKTVGGNLLIAFSTQTEIECYRSIDSGATWVDRANCFESATAEDWLFMYPADTADNNDACCLFLDRDGNDLSVKMYDDSANSWTETIIDANVSDSSEFTNHMGGAIRHSDKHLLVGAHNFPGQTANDLLTFDITVDSITSPTVTAKTNIFTNQAESGFCAMIINQQNDDVYIAYSKGGTFLSLMDLVFHKSDDDMATWGSEQAYSEAAADDIRIVHGGRTVGNDGGRIQWAFYNDDLTEIFVNLVNDIEIAASGGIIPQIVQHRKQQGFI